MNAKPDLNKAIKLYEATLPKDRDIHEFREIKEALKDIEANW